MEKSKENIIKSFSEMHEFGKSFAKTLVPGDIVLLHGNLGSGKTTFAQGVAQGLGITKRIISPTFIIMRTYTLQKGNLYHVDLYRIASEKDIEGLGLLELIELGNDIFLIEWPEKIDHLLPTTRKDLFFEYIDDNRRSIVIE